LKSPRGANNLPFDSTYWNEIYGDGYDVDGTFNAKEHAKYLKAIFDLMNIEVRSLLDVGFGKGILLKEFAAAFRPARIVAIDPSEERIQEILRKKWIQKYNIAIKCGDISSSKIHGQYTLAIFNSVAQYIPGDLEIIFKKLSRVARYVYFSAPTDKDYVRMKKEVRFTDPYAHHRSRKEYLAAISPWYNIVSYNLLERKSKSTKFNDEIFVQ